MRVIKCSAPAKLNLALHVTGQRADGYHMLDTLVAFCAFGDSVSVSRTGSLGDELELTGPFAASAPSDSSNLVMRAAQALRASADQNPCPPVSIYVEKAIPAGAGLGGGSADAAATLLALRALWEIGPEIDLASIAAELGADVPMCLQSSPLRARGIGEVIDPLKLITEWHALVVYPGKGLNTAQVFGALDKRNNPPIDLAEDAALEAADLKAMRNDLEQTAMKLCSLVAGVLEVLKNTHGARLVRMSGSGSACYALYEDAGAVSAAAEKIRSAYPDWWCAPTRVLMAAPVERMTQTGG